MLLSREPRLVLALLLVGLLPLGNAAAADRAEPVSKVAPAFWLEPISASGKASDGITRVDKAHVRDLVFKVEWNPGAVQPEGWGASFRILEVPQPFLLRSRTDLIPLVDSLTTDLDLATEPVLTNIAWLIMDHIDSPDAALLRLELPSRGKSRLTWISWPPPLPDDAATPAIWVTHICDPRVFAWLKARLDSLPDDTMSLWHLASCNSPEALGLIQAAFASHPGQEARYLDDILRHAPALGRRPVDFFLADVLPRIRSSWSEGPQADWGIMLWGGITFRRDDLSRSRQVEGLGDAYIQATLEDSAFYRIVTGKSAPTSADFAEAYAYGLLSVFLRVCKEFGTARQVKLLQSRLSESESWLSDSALAQTWDAHSTFSTPLPYAIEEYKRQKIAVISSMRSRGMEEEFLTR